MDSVKKDGKLPYEPPKIYELDVDMIQAMGASVCTIGASAAGWRVCSNGGNTRTTAACRNGTGASGKTCKTGSTVTSCNTGTSRV